MKREESESFGHRLLRILRNHFLSGILVVVPLVATIAVLAWFFITIDDFLQPLIERIVGHRITGVGFGIALVLIYVTGAVASNFFGHRIIRFGESLATRIPIFRQIYTGFKQVLEGLSGTGINKAAFREVILVEFPREGMRTVAFITNELIDESGNKLFAIFVPTAPVPTSGYFEIVTEDMITRTDISVDEAMKMVISSGMISPAQIDVSGVVKSKPETPPPKS